MTHLRQQILYVNDTSVALLTANVSVRAPASRVLASEPVAMSVGDGEVVVEAKSELALKGRGESVSAWTLRRS